MLKLHIFVIFPPNHSFICVLLPACGDFSKPFFGKIAQAPHYINLVGIQIMKLKKLIKMTIKNYNKQYLQKCVITFESPSTVLFQN
jgi:hypothetical protein